MSSVKQLYDNLIYYLEIDSSKFNYNKDCFHLNYQLTEYRQGDLSQLMIRTIYEYALTKEEYEKFKLDHDSEDFFHKAWERISNANPEKKGDYGEFLLWILLKFHYNIPKLLTKIKIKTNYSDQVKGFDCAHFTYQDKKLNLWLGESKFRKQFTKSILDEALGFLKDFPKMTSLKKEMSVLKSHLNSESEDELYKKVLDEINLDKSLDEYNFTFPFLFTYDSGIINKHHEISSEFESQLKDEIAKKFEIIDDNFNLKLPANFKIIFIIVPFKDINHFKEKMFKFEEGIRKDE